MDPGVAEALRRWRERFCKKRPLSGNILIAPDNTIVNEFSAARLLRRYLQLAGVTRVQLFEHGEARMRVRAHDLRASFVTVNLALGRSEAWITDRTGHKSSQMIYRYKRVARTHAELNLGGFLALTEAIPNCASLPNERAGWTKRCSNRPRARKKLEASGSAITVAAVRWFCKSVFDSLVLLFLECSPKLSRATVSNRVERALASHRSELDSESHNFASCNNRCTVSPV